MSFGNGIATYTNPSPTEFDFTLNANAKFWDGSPVTDEDAVFSLKRAADPKGGGFYAAVFDRVKSFDVTGEKTFKITLNQPDSGCSVSCPPRRARSWRRRVRRGQGQELRHGLGGIMCSGPFKLDSWKTGQGVKMVPNPSYWDSTLPKPKLTSLTLIGVPDDATLTAGLKTGAISGTYAVALSTLGQLETDPNVTVYQGAPFATEAMVISATKGPLADARRSARPLSYALDRQGDQHRLQGRGQRPPRPSGLGHVGLRRDASRRPMPRSRS